MGSWQAHGRGPTWGSNRSLPAQHSAQKMVAVGELVDPSRESIEPLEQRFDLGRCWWVPTLQHVILKLLSPANKRSSSIWPSGAPQVKRDYLSITRRPRAGFLRGRLAKRRARVSLYWVGWLRS